jgi:hypothetical protein
MPKINRRQPLTDDGEGCSDGKPRAKKTYRVVTGTAGTPPPWRFIEFALTRLLGPPAGWRNDRWWWHCPFHDDSNPSFSALPTVLQPNGLPVNERWRCFGCGEWGDVADMMEKRIPNEHWDMRSWRLRQWRKEYEAGLLSKKKKNSDTNDVATYETAPEQGPLASASPSSFLGKQAPAELSDQVRGRLAALFEAYAGTEIGDVSEYLERVHAACLERTSDECYERLGQERGLMPLTLQQHGLVFDAVNDWWLIPNRSADGTIVTMQRYRAKTNSKPKMRHWLPGLSPVPFGLDRVRPATEKVLLVCEGCWDGLVVQERLYKAKLRSHFDVLAVPTASVFRDDWLSYLEGYRAVRLCFDNDEAGRDGQERIVQMATEAGTNCQLFKLVWPAGYAEKADLRDLARAKVNLLRFMEQHCRAIRSLGEQE